MEERSPGTTEAVGSIPTWGSLGMPGKLALTTAGARNVGSTPTISTSGDSAKAPKDGPYKLDLRDEALENAHS